MRADVDGLDLCAAYGCYREATDFPYCLKHGEQAETYDRIDPYGRDDAPDEEGL